MISGLVHTLFAVLNGLRRTVADVRHTVGAVAAPERFAVLNRDVVRGAETGALATANAGIADHKGSVFDEEGVEGRIHRAAHKTVVETVVGGEGTPGPPG